MLKTIRMNTMILAKINLIRNTKAVHLNKCYFLSLFQSSVFDTEKSPTIKVTSFFRQPRIEADTFLKINFTNFTK